MNFDIYSYTNKGGRGYNEDFCGYLQDSDRGVFVVADGLGGHGHGEIASELAAKYILDNNRSGFDIEDDSLLKLAADVNNALINYQNQNPMYKNIRTTVVAAFFSGDVFKYFNVGDSRLYYFKNGCLYTQSKDHSVPQMAVSMGEITLDEIRTHEDRSKLLKVLGDTENLNIKKIEHGVKIETGDAFLLCTDGFWEYVFETEMELDLIKSSSPKEWCEFMCKRLLRRAPDNNDNFTVLCGIMTSPVTPSAWLPPAPVIPETLAAAPKTTKRRSSIILGVMLAVALVVGMGVWRLLSGKEELEIKPVDGYDVSTPTSLPPSTPTSLHLNITLKI